MIGGDKMETHFVAMKTWMMLGAVAAALALSGCGKGAGEGNMGGTAGPVTPIPAPQGSDWTETIAQTPEGGFRMGNPDAAVKLVEYASITCPHCKDFSQKATEPLKAELVKSGRVSWEFRPFALNQFDVPIFMVLRCQGPQPSFKLLEQLYALQDQWIEALRKMSPEQGARIDALPPEQRPRELFATTGLSTFFGQRGVTQGQIDQCLSNRANIEALEQLRQKGASDGVTGTPSFFINGRLAQESEDWPPLQAQLREAAGG